jgi:tripartite-type tricarboxylate transporter receptor subunit TctC
MGQGGQVLGREGGVGHTFYANIVKALATPEIKQQLANRGIEADRATPEQFAKFVCANVDKMAKAIKAPGAKPEQ